jgi:hypothetical protein
MECKNCANIFEGKFCNNCGQKTDTHRLTIKHYLHDALHTFTHLDTGIIHLIKELFLRPGEVIREYIGGARKKYFSPMQFLILGIGASTFLAITFQLFGPTQGGAVPGQSEAVADYLRQFNAFIYKFYNIMLFFSVPFSALFTYLFFKSSKYNFAENLVMNTFLSGERSVIYILFTPFFYFFKKYYFIVTAVYFISFSAYFIWGYLQFFKPVNKFTAVIKSIIIIIIHVIINQILMFMTFNFLYYKGEVNIFSKLFQ